MYQHRRDTAKFALTVGDNVKWDTKLRQKISLMGAVRDIPGADFALTETETKFPKKLRTVSSAASVSSEMALMQHQPY